MKLQFHPVYFVLTVVLFIIEILIGAYLHDAFIRPYGGDFLVVILIYCFVKSFVRVPVWPAAIGSLIFAYLVELSQYLHILNWLGWEHNRTAKLLMGSSFQWMDMLMYTLGMLLVTALEYIAGNRVETKKPYHL